MSVNISKQGVVNASGGDIKPNLLAGSKLTLKQTTDGSSLAGYTCPDRSLLKAGTVVVVSVDIEVYNVNTMRRIGVEPSFTTSNGNPMYIGKWTSDTTNRKERIYSIYTLPQDAINLSQNGIYIQDITFNSGGYIILSNPKLEISDHPTAWCPNINDIYYTSNNDGFVERNISFSNSISQIYKNHYEMIEFIEW